MNLLGQIRQMRSAPLAYREAVRLAQEMWQRSYREIAPDWRPSDDLVGVLSQISNMHAGLLRENTRLRAVIAAELRENRKLKGDAGASVVTWFALAQERRLREALQHHP